MRPTRALVPIIVAAVLAGGCSGGPDRVSDTGELRIAVRRPSSLDPAMLRDASGILIARQLFRPLAAYDPRTSALRPGAANWETLDGGSRFVFRLRSGNRFSNGRAVNAEDVRSSLNRLARKDTGSEAAFLMDAVAGFHRANVTGEAPELEGIRALDERTVEVRLSVPWFDFPYVVTHPSTSPVPKPEFESNPAAFALHPAGSGPYSLEAPIEQGRDIVLRPVSSREARVAKFLIYDRGQDAWRDFQRGRLDIAEAPPGKVEFAREKYGEAGFSPIAAGIYLGFNLRNPKFQDVRLRRALSLAIDREAIAHSVYGDAVVPARGIVPHGLAGRSEVACAGNCTRDLRRARALVNEVFGGTATPIAYDYPAGPAEDSVAAALKANLAEVGIVLELRPRKEELTSFFDLISSGGHEMFRLAWPAEYPLADWFLNPLFRSNSPDNHTGYSVAEVDDLLNRARAAPETKDRLALYRAVEKRVLADMVAIPVGFFRNRYVASERVGGFYADRLGGFEIARFSGS